MEKKNKIENPQLYKYLNLLPNFKEKKTQAFTTITLTLLALSIFGFFAINPTLSTIAKLKKELSDSKLIDGELGKKIQALSFLQNQYNLLENDIPLIFQAVPQTPLVPLLAAQTHSLAKSNAVTLERLESFEVELSQKKGKEKKNQAYSFSVHGNGSYSQIIEFAKNLINFERVVSIDVISITQPEEKNILNVNIRGKAYYKP